MPIGRSPDDIHLEAGLAATVRADTDDDQASVLKLKAELAEIGARVGARYRTPAQRIERRGDAAQIVQRKLTHVSRLPFTGGDIMQ